MVIEETMIARSVILEDVSIGKRLRRNKAL